MELLSKRMKFLCLFAALVAVFAPSRSFAGAEDGGTAESLATAEKAFARESVEKGMRTAFLNALSDEGVVFEPGPGAQNGKKTWAAKKESSDVLDWQPILAVVASSGDLGYTTGPWSYRKSPNEKPSGFGEFVSVWRRENGSWKLFCDLGANHPPSSLSPPGLKLIDLPPSAEAKPAQFTELQKLDHDYASNRALRFDAVAGNDIRLYPSRKFPVLGKSASAEALKVETTAITFGESKGDLSGAGDLGFLYGEYRDGAAASATGDYLRIWSKNEQGSWKLMLDLVRPR
jgi:ketosteroid isomerase-like protein